MTRWARLAAAAVLSGALMASALGADVPSGRPAMDSVVEPFAPQAAPRDLPSNEQVQPLIADEPGVVQARYALEAARQRAAALTAGPYEWTVRAWTQRRRYRNGGPDATESSAGIDRTLRIGGKAALDRQLGEASVRLAEARLGEARHEAARALLEAWLDWLAADRTQRLWADQLGLAEANFKAVEGLRRAGDASMLEQNAARADLAEVQRQLSAAAGNKARAAARLQARFPQLVLQPTALGDPMPLAPGAALWRERILAESDPLRIAEEGLRRAELTAARARADRLPDPTVGVYVGSEAAGGAERIVGLTLAIPLGGTYRSAQMREALQQVEVARAAVEVQRRQLEAEIGENLAVVETSLKTWQSAEQAVAATRENARLAQRAYALGEADVQSVLLARRQSVDAALGAAQARTDALRARYRLLVDAHLIWGLHDE